MTLLAHQVIEAEALPTEKRLLFLHGILGSGANLRTLAKRVCANRPGWGAVLVDLRMHGRSQEFPAPHTVEAAAGDVLALTRALPFTVHGIAAHSFGGKVALRYLDQVGGDLDEVTLLDSSPGPRPSRLGSETTLEVLAVLEQAPAEFASREEFVQYARNAGLSEMLAAWLAMNVVPTAGGQVRFRLDLTAIRALLADYFLLDSWPTLRALPGRVRAHLVLGGASTVYDDTARAEADRLAASPTSRVRVTVVPGAGHWLHVDAFDATVAAIG